MHLKLLRAAAAVAVLGGTATLGLGVQAAMATPTTHNVLCATNGTDGLIYWMTSPNYASGDTLSLAPHCTYWVSAQLPSVMHDPHHRRQRRQHRPQHGLRLQHLRRGLRGR